MIRPLWFVLVVAVGCAGSDPSPGRPVGAEAAAKAPAYQAEASPPDACDAPGGELGSREAAAAVICDYYEAIAAEEYERAYHHWVDEGAASKQTLEEFRAGYAETATVEVEIAPPGRIDGAAGSRFVNVPVSIRARTTAGEAQQFCGSYTMVRAVVTGATEAQRHWHIHAADISDCAPATAATVSAEVTDVVTRFGKRLQRVSLQEPEEAIAKAIRAEYGPLVTDDLLAAWLADPASAPGRAVSSPWPDRIEIRSVQRVDEAYQVEAEVVEVTSVEVVRGNGAAARHPVVIRLEQTDAGTWRIAAYDPT